MGSSPQVDAKIKKHLPEITTYQSISGVISYFTRLQLLSRMPTQRLIPLPCSFFLPRQGILLERKKNSFHEAGVSKLKMWDE